ncbi:MAG: glycosyltransferase family 4 protein [Candidatus Aminicenantes bacterium]|nr:glycosyltransferase family 4 protein [Candidatus Aminicenantes bacterium]
MPPLRIAALLPHVDVYGGVRRYLELGNALAARGHRFVLYHPAGGPPAWLDFRAETRPFAALGEEPFDIGMCGEYSILPVFDKLPAARRFFYFVLEGHKAERAVARRRDLLFLGNSEGICRRLEKRYGIVVERAPGGVNPAIFHPVEATREGAEFRVLCYGRITRKRKGVPQVIRAVEGLARRGRRVRMIFFDTQVGQDRRDPRPLIRTDVPFDFHLNLPQERMAWLYAQADVFVSAERRAGWSNTCAEAMACRVPVVCTPSGTRDFAEDGRTALVVPRPSPRLLRRGIERLMRDPDLRAGLAGRGYDRILSFRWETLAERLEGIFRIAIDR